MIQTGNDVNAHIKTEEPVVPFCTKKLKCGHQCNGVKNERTCPPCLDSACAANHYKGGVNADDLCRICFTYELGADACSQLSCGHIYHTNCLVNQLKAKWSTLYYTWRFMNCPECNQEISFTHLSKPIAAELGPLISIKKKAQVVALENAQRQGLLNNPAFTEKDSELYGKQQETADAKCAVYPCFECKKPFFGGLRDCENEMQQQERQNTKPEDLLCQECLIKEIGVGQTKCKKHGDVQIDWKCQYCCSVAVYKCWGTNYFCERCHSGDFKTVKDCGGVKCPLGIAHPPPNSNSHLGGVFPLGCGICRSENLEKLKSCEIKQIIYDENRPKAWLYDQQNQKQPLDIDRPLVEIEVPEFIYRADEIAEEEEIKRLRAIPVFLFTKA